MKQAGNWNTAFLEKKNVNKDCRKSKHFFFLGKCQLNKNLLPEDIVPWVPQLLALYEVVSGHLMTDTPPQPWILLSRDWLQGLMIAKRHYL